MIFKNSDLWFIHSILNIQFEEMRSGLRNLIAFADYTNHSIMSFDEFSGAIAKFKALGLVAIHENTLKVSIELKDWYKKKYENKKLMNFRKETEDIKAYLESNFSKVEKEWNMNEIDLLKDEYNKALNNYLNSQK